MASRQNKRRKGISSLVTGVLLGIVISFALMGYLQKYSNFSLDQLFNLPSQLIQTTQTTTTSTSAATTPMTPTLSGKEVSMILPAVDEEGNGVTTWLYVEAIPGKGRVLVDVDNILFFTDTQNSIRVAERVAQGVTGIDLSKVDLIYRIDAGNVSVLEGPSAGASLAVATVAALEGKQVNSSVVMTGTIDSDGTIGPIGGVAEKAQAAKDIGAQLFLVPKGQGTSATYKPVQRCEQIGPILYCTNEYQGTRKDISSSIGIQIREVSTVQEALPYFLI